MPRFAANLSFMFQDIGFLDRFDAAARSGFKAVEFLFPFDHPPETIAERLWRNNLSLALFNTVAGDWAGGERGLAALPGREAEFRDGVDKAILDAQATGCSIVHAMAGLWPEGGDSGLAYTERSASWHASTPPRPCKRSPRLRQMGKVKVRVSP